MIEFTKILTYLKEMLESELETTRIQIEPTLVGDTTFTTEIGLSMNETRRVERTLGASDPYETSLFIDVLCSAYNPDGMYDACVSRDALIGRVEDILKTDRTLGGLVGQTQLTGVTFQTAETEAGYFSAGVIKLRVIMMA